MKLKRLTKIQINSYIFKVEWDKAQIGGGSFSYGNMTITIGVKECKEEEIFMVLCHELMEICAAEMNVRFRRPDCDSDYIFVYDHRQYETMINMFSGLISKFIK